MNTYSLRLVPAALLCAAGLLSACGGSSDGAAVALMNTAAIAADAQGCPAGGRSFEYGVDTDASGTLSDNEFQSAAVLCGGGGEQEKTRQDPLAAGDPRCDSGGGSVLTIDPGDGTQPVALVACSSGIAAQGLADASDASGATGDTSQKIGDGVVKCKETYVPGQSCVAPRIDGVVIGFYGPVSVNSVPLPMLKAICRSLSGKTPTRLFAFASHAMTRQFFMHWADYCIKTPAPDSRDPRKVSEIARVDCP